MHAVFERTLKLFLEPVLPFLQDSKVTEVLVNGSRTVYVERQGQLEKTDACFPSDDALMAVVRHIAQFVGRELDETHPQLDARLPDGSRVHVVLPPLSRQGVVVAIRKFSPARLTLRDMVERGTLSPEAAQLLAYTVRIRKNLIISGGTGSGKTTLLNVLSGLVRPNERIVVIEDASELQFNCPHVLYFESRPPDFEGQGGVGIRDLFKSALRLRPDRIIIGETRGPEALDLLQAMISGHRGSMSTLHATTPWDALYRLETMALLANIGLPLEALRRQITSAIQVVVQIERLYDGSRRILSICEVLPKTVEGAYQVEPLFVWEEPDGVGERGGRLIPTGALPTFLGELSRAGLPPVWGER